MLKCVKNNKESDYDYLNLSVNLVPFTKQL